MRLERFKVERWMDEYEGFLTYDLGETCVSSLTVKELFDLCGENPDIFFKNLQDKRLVYGWIHGSPELNSGIAGLYKDLKASEVVPTHGGISANHMVLAELSSPEVNVVTVVPTYQQHYSIPESLGAEVRILKLRRENNFHIDMEELKSLVDSKTELISVCTPDNPTGAVVSDKDIMAIVDVAKANDAYVLFDEAYRGATLDGSYPVSIVDVYEKGISTSSMSKIFGLAGLRLGWVATKDKELMHRIHARRDYDTISCGAIDDMLSSMAIAHKDAIFDRTRKIVKEGREVLDKWVEETPGVSYVKPEGGTIALVHYDAEVDSFEFCVKLVKERGVLVTPGEAFDMEKCFRVGYAFSPAVLKKGLDIIAQLLSEYK